MKVLWIVNIIFPFPAKQLGIREETFGGWLKGLSASLAKMDKIELSIVSLYKGVEMKEYNDGRITYFLIPNNKDKNKYWKELIDKNKPDLIHIHGTEYARKWKFIEKEKINKIISIQGLIYMCSDVYYANISIKDILKNITFRDIIRQDNLIQQKKKFLKRGQEEKKLIKNANAIIGRTKWDYANTKAINSNLKYYASNETLRESFYKEQWDINQVETHSIFCSQAGYPIKGVHYLLKAVSILKYQYGYNDIKLYIAGPNIVDNSNIEKKLKMNGYANYIRKLIHNLGIEEQVRWTGILNEKQMVSQILKTHVFVLPSAIENSSNSLGEAMLLGMPCVATNTGGTMDILKHEKEGFLYPYTEPAMCAEYISNFFEDDELAIRMGKTARKKALERHDPEKNAENIIEIYKKVIGEL